MKTTISLAAGCILTGTALWWLGKPELLPYARSEKRSTVLNSRLGEINEIVVSGRNGTERKYHYSNGGWHMTEPSGHPADPTAIARLLDIVEHAPLLDCISAKECSLRELSEADFGFDHPAGGVTLSGPGKFRTGARITIGDYSQVSNEVFVAVGNQAFPNDVCVTTREIADIVNEPEVNFIDRRLFRNNPRRVNTIIFARGEKGTVKLVRDRNDRWLITQPVQARADWDVIDSLFGILYSAEIINLQPGVNAKDTGCGDSSAVRIQVFGQDVPAGISVTLGNPATNSADVVYAQIGGDYSPVVITGAVERLTSMTMQELRDKRIFGPKTGLDMDRLSFEQAGRSLSFKKNDDGAWSLTSPVAASASPDVVSKLISSVLSLTAASVSDVKPASDSAQNDAREGDSADARSFLAVSFSEDGTAYNLKISEVADDALVSTQKIYKAVLNRGNTVYELRDNPAVEYILECLNMPHLAVDKTIFDIKEKDVSRLEITREDGSSEIIERAGGEWKSACASESVSKTVLANFFKTVHPLIADSVISANPSSSDDNSAVTDPTDTSRVVISFNFTDGVSLQRTLILGPAVPDPQNGFYARIKGHNAVYAISHETMSSLTQSLITPVSPEGELPSAPPLATSQSGTSTK